MPDKTLDFRDHQKLAKFFAHRLFQRSKASGLRMSFDDIYAEVSLTWVQCRDGFNPACGIKFETYWTRAVFNNWKMMVQRNVDRTLLKSDSVMVGLEEGEESDNILDYIPSTDIDPEEEMERKQALQRLNREKTPMLTALLDLSIDPPEEIREELEALHAQYALAQEQGISMEKPATMLTPKHLLKTLGFNWRDRKRLLEEITEIVKNV